ncbi:uncharacterized protein LOC135477870 [Liolophura sinensis]|uniref:uncharacterized protein LOC135477870 n=1 Tax=Liolophura sinensis TaxID=3198878 RepID=UPI00315944E5
MTANYLCAQGVCGEYGDLLYQFKPWIWFADDVPTLQGLCVYDNAKCTTRKEVEENQEEELKEEAEQTSGGVSNDVVWGTEPPEVITEGAEINGGGNPEEMKNDESAYTLWVTEEIDVSTVLIVAAISVAALGFFFLVGLVWCLKRRRSRHRVREGVEYMEILPDMDD